MMKERKFQYFGHRVCGGGTARAVVERGMVGRCGRGRPQGNWIGNLKGWNGKRGLELSKMVKEQGGWKRSVYDWVHPWLSRLMSK